MIKIKIKIKMIKKIQNNFINIQSQINKLFSYLIIAYFFIVPISHIYSNKFINLLIILWILSFDFKAVYLNILNSKILKSVLLLTILIATSYMYKGNYIATNNEELHYANFHTYFSDFTIFFLYPIIIITTKLRKDFIPYVISAFIFGMLLNEIITYGVYFEFWTTTYGTPHNPIPFHKTHITYSTFVGFTVLLTIYKFKLLQNNYEKIFYMLFLTTMFINLLLNYGRTGQFSFFITLIFLVFIYYKKSIKHISVLLLSISILFIISYNTVDTFHVRVNQAKSDVSNILNSTGADTSFGTRILAFDTIPYLMNRDNILFGVGMGNKTQYISNTLSKSYPYYIHSFNDNGYLHDSHVEMLVSNGIIGLLVYMSIFFFLLKSNIKDKYIKYISTITGIYFFCYGLSADIFFAYEPMNLFAILISIVIIQQEYERQNSERR